MNLRTTPACQLFGLELTIENHLKSVGHALTETELLCAVKGRRQSKIKALRGLFESNRLIRTGEGKRGNPYQYEYNPQDINLKAQRLVKIETANSSRPASIDDAAATVDQSTAELFYKQYKLPNGELLQLTKEAFARVVETIRLLQQQDEKINLPKNGVA